MGTTVFAPVNEAVEALLQSIQDKIKNNATYSLCQYK